MPVSIASILSLARAGATQHAWERFTAAGYSTCLDDPSVLTLKARLLKDKARAAMGAERVVLFSKSSAAYLAAAKIVPHDSYPLINAATIALFAGDRSTSVALAHDVLTLLSRYDDAGETPYWRAATRAEALLLLGDVDGAQLALAQAVKRAPHAWEDHAATLRQFALILSETGADPQWLNPFRPPSALHFSGILGIAADDSVAAQGINAAVDRIAPGFGYGAIAAGADILIAECLITRAAELHIILPCDPRLFRSVSVEPYRADWADRYDALMDAATSVTICANPPTLSAAAISLADQCAMGMALEKAAILQCLPVSLRVEPEGRLQAVELWSATGHAIHRLSIDPAISDHPGVAMAEGALGYFVAMGDAESSIEPRVYATLKDALAALPSDGPRAAVDVAIGQVAETDAIRMAAILRNAAPGTILASQNAAMAALAQNLVKRVEPMGEMAYPEGALPLYAITRR